MPEEKDFELQQITDPLLAWYKTHARSLPWREEVTPYRVWVSEIMLQQTRVEAVKPYFARFMEALPDIASLADCPEQQLLKLWEGLGYYNRVRNMQQAAREIMDRFGGEMPANVDQLLSLKGIGRYTAGAIASSVFHIPVSAVDGNVMRVIMRLTGDESDIMKQSVRTRVEEMLTPLITEDNAGIFNQALMELGALVCVPNGEPKCGECPWGEICCARAEESWERIPVKKKPKERRLEERTILVIRDDDKVVLGRRPDHGLLAGLYELPGVPGYLTEEEALQWVRDQGLMPLHIRRLEDAKHIFSHVEWHMRGYMIRVDSLTRSMSPMLFVNVEETERSYPLPAAFKAYTRYMEIRLGQEKYNEQDDPGRRRLPPL